MAKLRAHNISVSLDGYLAGPDQALDAPLGVGGQALHEWVFATRYGRRMIGQDGGTEGVDDAFLARGDQNIGATVMGRNMFGPVRGPWPDEEWTGWWGEEPPYHHPVFVLTHHARPPLAMKGGTVFHFVTDGLDAALDRAFEAAGGADVRVGGGAAALQQCLFAGKLDELHIALVPVLLGRGERLFEHLDGGPEGYECVEFVSSPSVAHLRFERTGRRAQAPSQ
ncbi:dihydrofolate reductase family protein [Streptacidiphilus sp. MAP12-20]|uniref:dihydrofolate reductase family protein n=1 Tax=Streptacidiphilus sp. MAP12-20 TaxID=3156299 RepID=UPI003512BC0F